MNHANLKVIFSALALMANLAAAVSAQDNVDRTVLPIQEPERPTYAELDVRNAKAPPRFEVKAPKKAPNVVIVLIDDVGFGEFGIPLLNGVRGFETPNITSLPPRVCLSVACTPSLPAPRPAQHFLPVAYRFAVPCLRPRSCHRKVPESIRVK